jgi:hypothetical protein
LCLRNRKKDNFTQYPLLITFVVAPDKNKELFLPGFILLAKGCGIGAEILPARQIEADSPYR